MFVGYVVGGLRGKAKRGVTTEGHGKQGQTSYQKTPISTVIVHDSNAQHPPPLAPTQKTRTRCNLVGQSARRMATGSRPYLAQRCIPF